MNPEYQPKSSPVDRSSREYKDSVMKLLFRDEKRAPELCNAVSGMNYPEGTPVPHALQRKSRYILRARNICQYIIQCFLHAATSSASVAAPGD